MGKETQSLVLDITVKCLGVFYGEHISKPVRYAGARKKYLTTDFEPWFCPLD